MQTNLLIKNRFVLTGSLALLILLTMFAFAPSVPSAFGQESPENSSVNEPAPVAAAETDDEVDTSTTTVSSKSKGLNLLNLLTRGGWLMLPLALLSVLVVGIAIERMLALREDKVLPKPLVRELGNLSRNPDGFDPRMAFQACQQFPSAASRVLRVMLLKAGRPQAEVDNAVSEAAERESTRLQSMVSWLTLAAAVAPLVGLLGTVWGMIQAFYDTTQLVPGQNKADVLSEGIYTALVTTLCGLVIAIPAAVLAHYYDNKIVSWFHKIEELAASLTPMLEPYEGRMRASDNQSAFAANSDAIPSALANEAAASSSPVREPDVPHERQRTREREPVAVVPPPSKRPR